MINENEILITCIMNISEIKNSIPIVKYIPGPRKIKRLCFEKVKLPYLMHFRQWKYADYLFKRRFGHTIDWEHPRDLNEWMNYLEHKTDTSEWTRLADKYAVRKFVEERGVAHILLPLFGKWEKPSDIDFDKLPTSFVMKTNGSCGDVIIVEDKDKADYESIREKLSLAMAQRDAVFLRSGEPHYLGIKQIVICEQLILPIPVEYKFFCFHGEPLCVLSCSNRDLEAHTVDWMLYDLDWNRRLDWMDPKFRKDIVIERPSRLNEMIEYARILSKGFPHVRVDLYAPDDHVYFGEMTFTSTSSRINWCTPEFLKAMGEKVKEGMK